MLTFRARELGLPTFQSTGHESKIASVTAVKSDIHTFMPYYSIDFNLKRVYQSDEFKVILDAIYAEFGPIPYGPIRKSDERVGVSFNLEQFVVPGFINKLAALLHKLQLVSAQDKQALLDFFEENKDQIKAYIQAGKDCHRVANEKIRLHRLIEDRNPTLDEIEELLKDSSVDVNFQDGYGSTALMKAVKENRADIVKLLLERGADPHLIDWFGDRPLEIASYCDRLEIAELLLNHGADPNLFWGNSAMHNAFSMASDEMVTLLARYGARCDVQNRWGETPINQSINSRHHDNGETVRRRTQIAEKKGRMDLVSYQPETVKQKVVQKKKQTQPVTIGQQLLALSATLSRVVDDSVATELANSMRKINIASKELQHKEYKIWFNACLSLSAKDQASIKPFDSQVNVANVALMKRAFLAWLQSLDNETAIRACAMACNRETVLGRLLYIKCGWLAPSIERGTLKQVNERLQILRQQQMKIQVSPKLEEKTLPQPSKAEKPGAVGVSEPESPSANQIDTELAGLTRDKLYPDASSLQMLEATTGILVDKHARIDALHAETGVVEQDVMTLLFDRMPSNLPLPLQPTILSELPTPLRPTKLNLVAPLEADIITSSEDREKIVAKMLDALPHAPQARLFYQERSEQIKPSDDATKIAGKRQAIKVGMQ